MRIWALVSQKGGATKSTNTIHLAVAAVQAGERVAIIDCDTQKSATDWWTSREGDETEPYVFPCPDVSEVEGHLQVAKDKGFTHIFIDTPGNLDEEFQKAASVSTMCVIPAAPSVMDLKPSITTAHYLKETGKNFVFFITRVPPVGSEGSQAIEALSAYGLVCKHWTTDRKGHKRSYSAGLGITEYAEFDKTAEASAQEVRNIYNWIINKENKLNYSFGQSTTDEVADENLTELEAV